MHNIFRKVAAIFLGFTYIDEIHYANMSVQYTAIFHGCKNGNFLDEKCDIFLIFAQNKDRRYSIEPPH